ncbi:MAG: hypothetical protein COA74_02165 [Gammaproteobacteria bacterium]|nr:MAG: hypothetical protein COA74_02165 [Gammaproteobacteria bacterium]
MSDIQFAHANGFPAKTYEYMFSLITAADVHYINTMGHDERINKGDLAHLRDELIEVIESHHKDPVIGIGHSSGAAATLLAAAKRPDLFAQVILLDPIIFGRKKRFGIRLLKLLGLWASKGPARKALRRRTNFDDKQQAFDYFKTKALFKDFHTKSYDSYIEHGLKQAKEGVELSFSAQVEADIFKNTPTRIPKSFAKSFSKIKGTIIYGQTSDVFNQDDINWWKKYYPNFKMIAFPGAHLFPLEQPEETAKLINELSNTLSTSS